MRYPLHISENKYNNQNNPTKSGSDSPQRFLSKYHPTVKYGPLMPILWPKNKFAPTAQISCPDDIWRDLRGELKSRFFAQ